EDGHEEIHEQLSSRFPSRLRAFAVAFALVGCMPPPRDRSSPDVSPATQPSANLAIDSSNIQPMYRELMAVDLPTVVRVASIRNIEVEAARQRVLASRGRHEASVEGLFPIIAP